MSSLPRELEEYRRCRREYYDRFPDFWATFPPGTEAVEEYAVYGAVDVRREVVADLRLASERLLQVLSKVARWVQVSPDDVLLTMGVPSEAFDYSRLSIPGIPSTVVGRFEFAVCTQGPKLLEFNAETPTLVVELFSMNGQVCRDFGLVDPNGGCAAQLGDALITAIEAGLEVRGVSGTVGNVIFSSWGEHKEDRGTVQYLQSLVPASPRYRVSYCPLEELQLTADELRDGSGQSIDVLYKLYPTEHLLQDYAPDLVPVGRMVMGLIRAGRLVVMNPPVSFLLQNKALLALTWSLHEARAGFISAEEHDWIESYFLPTYLDRSDEEGHPVFSGTHVAKPVYGREGDSITVHRADRLVEAHPNTTYAHQLYIYQQHAELARTTLLTEQGRQVVNLVFNCFVAGGKASAVGLRAGPSLILDDNAYFVPMCYAQESQD